MEVLEKNLCSTDYGEILKIATFFFKDDNEGF